jgi:transcriptional regulator with PAS, ATPase and Fis domain
MAANPTWAIESGAINDTAFFEIDDAMSAKIERENNESSGNGLRRIVGNSAALRRVLGLARLVAPTDATVLINGETGIGKELITEAIHRCGNRPKGLFVKVNWAAIPGGFPGKRTVRSRAWRLHRNGRTRYRKVRAGEPGTLFLDEIGHLPLQLQPQLLRVTQGK